MTNSIRRTQTSPDEFRLLSIKRQIHLVSEIYQQTVEQTKEAGRLCRLAKQAELKSFTKCVNAKNCNLRNYQGQTPLMLAVMADTKAYERCEHLVNYQADATATDNIYHNTALHLAAMLGNDEKIVYLLASASADVNAKNCLGNTPLIEATIKNKVAIVMSLLHCGANIYLKNGQNRTALQIADRKNFTQIGQILRQIVRQQREVYQERLLNKYKLSIDEFRQLTADGKLKYIVKAYGQSEQQTLEAGELCELAINGKFDELKNRINQRNCDWRNFYGQTPLMVSSHAVANAYECCQYLLNYGANLQVSDCFNYNTPLHYAAGLAQDERIVPLLLTSPTVEVNAQNAHGVTPLMLAIRKHKLANVKFLLQSGANVHIENDDGETALQIAEDHNSREIATCLRRIIRQQQAQHPLEAGLAGVEEFWRMASDERVQWISKIYDQSEQETLQADRMCELAKHGEIQEFLDKANAANCDWRNRLGQTPLMSAVQASSNAVEICEYLLLLRCCKINSLDNINHNTALHYAAASAKDAKVMQMLAASQSVDVNAQNWLGNTPLIEAAINNNAGNVELLLHYGADVNVENYDGKTAVQLAEEHNFTQIVQILTNL